MALLSLSLLLLLYLARFVELLRVNLRWSFRSSRFFSSPCQSFSIEYWGISVMEAWIVVCDIGHPCVILMHKVLPLNDGIHLLLLWNSKEWKYMESLALGIITHFWINACSFRSRVVPKSENKREPAYRVMQPPRWSWTIWLASNIYGTLQKEHQPRSLPSACGSTGFQKLVGG